MAPFINKPKRPARTMAERSENSRRAARLVYNTRRWRRLRDAVLMENPLCQMCGKELSVEVHHRRPLADARDDDQMVEWGFDPNNLQCLCERCHDIVHRTVKGGKRGK